MKKSFFCSLLVLLCACGREGPPFPPEVVSPKAVDQIQTKASDKQLTFSWIAPTTNVRGKKLKELSGYRIYRTTLMGDAKIEELKNDDFELLATLQDNTMQLLEKKKAEAKLQGKPESKAKLAEQERLVSFTDKSVVSGRTYVYRIAPYNHSWVDGAVPQIVKVAFKGTNSEVAVLDNQIGIRALEDSAEFLQTQ